MVNEGMGRGKETPRKVGKIREEVTNDFFSAAHLIQVRETRAGTDLQSLPAEVVGPQPRFGARRVGAALPKPGSERCEWRPLC